MINPHLVRGLDYYTKTVFELWSGQDEGKKSSLGGGGRYDKLISMIGGENTPAIGFGLGVERVIAEMKRVQAKPFRAARPRVFLAQLGDLAKKKSLKLFSELEKNCILTAESFGRGSLKAQLRAADKLGVEITLILGQKEALDKTVIIKNMTTGVQETVRVERLTDIIKKRLKNENVVVYHDSSCQNGNGSDSENGNGSNHGYTNGSKSSSSGYVEEEEKDEIEVETELEPETDLDA
jgi:histidyl-tRNA synthetase